MANVDCEVGPISSRLEKADKLLRPPAPDAAGENETAPGKFMTLDKFMRTQAFKGCLRRLASASSGNVITGRAELGGILFSLVEAFAEESGNSGRWTGDPETSPGQTGR